MNHKEIVQAHFDELIKEFPTLLLYWDKEKAIIEGDLSFKANYSGHEIEDSYSIKISIPPTYPEIPPTTWETGGRIPSRFHRQPDHSLCLEAPTKVVYLFRKNPILSFYVKKFVIEYLYSFSYNQEFGNMPFGERSHGTQGIIEFYKELLQVSSAQSVFKALDILSKNNYRGHHDCFCGSKKRLRNCHGSQIRILMQENLTDYFQADKDDIYYYLKFKRSV